MSNNYDMEGSQNQFDQLSNMYPEIYNDVLPFITQFADDIERNGYMPTDDMINTLVDNIIKMSGMWDEDDEVNYNYDGAVPVQLGFGRRRGRRRGHNRNTLRDIIRILLLRELFDRRRFRR